MKGCPDLQAVDILGNVEVRRTLPHAAVEHSVEEGRHLLVGDGVPLEVGVGDPHLG